MSKMTSVVSNPWLPSGSEVQLSGAVCELRMSLGGEKWKELQTSVVPSDG